MSYGSKDYYRPTGFGGFSIFPPVIKKLLLINVGVFFLQMIFDNISIGGYPGWYLLNRYFSLNPLVGIDPAGQPFNFQIWQLISYQFMHGGFSHIFFNMFMLWMFGMEIENIMGSRKFLLFYLLSGIGAGLFQLLLAPLFSNQLAFTIGASGAVFGVMIAFALFFPNRLIFVYFLFPVKAKYLIAFLVLIEFMAVGNQSVVAHFAHVGGALTGLIFILLDRKNNFNVDGMFNKIKNKTSGFKSKRNMSFGKKNVEDAEFYEINNQETEDVSHISQEEIDRILDKISTSGYQNLTEEEKRVLFEASKRR